MDKIQELKKKHYNIKEVIKNHIRRKTDCKKHVEQYLEIIQQLKSLGVEVNDKSTYINQALEQYNVDKNSIITPSILSTPSIVTLDSPWWTELGQPAPPIQETSIYKITLAWTERPGKEPDNTIQIIENYLKENGAKEMDSTSADFDDYKENMQSYEWIGGDKEFAILRKSANYILDVFAENQYEKFNISIFGNKKR